MEIRPARPSDHEGIIDLVLGRHRSLTAALVTQTVSVESASEHLRLLVAEESGRLVGTGLLFRPVAAPPGLAVENVTVQREAEVRGIGAALHAALGTSLPEGTTFVVTQVDEDDERSLAVAEHWGFARLEVSVTSRLRLEDPTRPDLPSDVSVDASPLLTFGDEDEVERMLDVSQTNPEREQGIVVTLAGLRGMASEGGAVPTGVVLRVDGRPAAITYAVTARDEAQVVYTGVDPALRGRGLARLAKEVLHADLAAAGARTCVTNNADENAGIRHVNDQLGYRPSDSAVYLRRPVADD